MVIENEISISFCLSLSSHSANAEHSISLNRFDYVRAI